MLEAGIDIIHEAHSPEILANPIGIVTVGFWDHQIQRCVGQFVRLRMKNFSRQQPDIVSENELRTVGKIPTKLPNEKSL
jgi:hypothetical protein